MYDPFQADARPSEPPPVPRAAPASTSRWSRISILLLAVVLVLGLPLFVEQVQYAVTRGRERAKAEVARVQLASLDSPSDAFRLVAQSVGPSVVYINAIEESVDDGGIDDEWSSFLRRRERTGQGSGVIVDEGGYVLTNYHVIASASRVAVKLSDGRRVSNVKIVGIDPPTDLAVLKINASGLIAAPWGDSEELEVGDWVLAVGNPFGLDRSVTAGIVSAKGRRGIVPGSPYQDFLQTDAAVNPGNSGGPLANMRGEIVGINTAILGSTYQGVSFAIPSEIAREVYEQLRKDGKLVRGWLGVSLQTLTPRLAEELELDVSAGAVVTGVLVGTPAQQAGIEVGDVIVQWDGLDVRDSNDLSLAVAKTPVGQTVEVKLYRKGEAKTVEVTVAERPAMR